MLFHLLATLGNGALRDKIEQAVHIASSDVLVASGFPTVTAEAFHVFLRTLAGMEDLARTNAHFDRRGVRPTLHRSTWNRCCPHRFYCPQSVHARREFQLVTKLSSSSRDCSAKNTYQLSSGSIK